MRGRYKRSTFLFCTSLFIAACYGPVTLTDSHEVRTVIYPDTKMIRTAKVGEALVARASKTIVPALQISAITTFGKAEGEATIFYCGLTFEPGVIPQRGTIRSMGRSGICFGPSRGSATAWDGTTSSLTCNGYTAQMDICEDVSDGTFFVYYPNYNKSAVIPLEQDFENITKTEMVVSSDSNFLKELVYLGKSGNKLKFLYRESQGDLSEPSYEKEWDVAVRVESTSVTYGGASIEIISANNDEAKYRVESNFH